MDPVLKANQTVGTFPLVLTPKNPWNNLERQGSPPHNPGSTNCPSMECIVKRNQLRWIGLVVRMVDSRNNFFSESFVRVCDVPEDNLSVTKMPLGYLEDLPYTSI